MTLIEIMTVVGVIGLLAALALPAFLKAARRAQDVRFQSDLRAVSSALEIFRAVEGKWPDECSPGVAPAGISEFLKRFRWDASPAIGGQWDWDANQNGYVAAISVVGPSRDDDGMREVDKIVDDGNLATGSFRGEGATYSYVLEFAN